MRELKFRAWGNRQNKYLNPDDVSIRADGFITIFNVDGKHSRAVQPPGDLLSPWFIIEQYTNLKDKNGTEIYEGDIVSLRLWGSNGYEYENGIVRYYPPSAAFKWFSLEDDKNDCNNYWLQHADSDGREVVGNIHENPELLEEK